MVDAQWIERLGGDLYLLLPCVSPLQGQLCF